jgi:meiotically up-regulated gene 157 (Mug157) protein
MRDKRLWQKNRIFEFQKVTKIEYQKAVKAKIQAMGTQPHKPQDPKKMEMKTLKREQNDPRQMEIWTAERKLELKDSFIAYVQEFLQMSASTDRESQFDSTRPIFEEWLENMEIVFGSPRYKTDDDKELWLTPKPSYVEP